MKSSALLAVILLILSSNISSQNTRILRNLKKAVLQLSETTPDSVKTLIKTCGTDSIRQISYPLGGEFKTVFNWTNRNVFDSKLRDYLENRGIYRFQVEVILISFKEYLNHGNFDEEKIIDQFLDTEEKLRIENENRYVTDTLNGIYIPIDMIDCFNQLEILFNDTTKVQIKSLSEEDFIANSHFGIGLWLRNNWQLWGGSRLSKYFTDKGIHHPDDMSGIVLSSYHRHLTNKDIKLDEQIEYYQEYWRKAEEAESQREKEELTENRLYLEEWQIGDTLEFNYNNGFISQGQEDEWMDDICIAKGILLEKDGQELQIKVKVIKSCDKKGIVYYDNIDRLIYDKDKKQWVKPKKRVIKSIKRGKSRWFNLDEWDLY